MNAVCTGTNAIARLVRNSLEPHISCWLIWSVWLAVSDAAIYSRIFRLLLLRLPARDIARSDLECPSKFTLDGLAALVVPQVRIGMTLRAQSPFGD